MQKGIKNFCWKIPQRKKKKGWITLFF
jgi:hypothetical protein